MFKLISATLMAVVVLIGFLGVGISFQGSTPTAYAQPAPDLSLTKRHYGSFIVGSTSATYVLQVSNADTAGPTTGPITVTDTLPPGLTFGALLPSRDLWSCRVSGQSVTCTTPGPLDPGSVSEFSLTVNIAQAALGQVTNTAAVSTPGDTKTINNGASDQVAVAPSFGLTVNKSGSGGGHVNSNIVAGIQCGTDCSEFYASGTRVGLTAWESADSNFVGWGGACAYAGRSSFCDLTMTKDEAVTATFQRVKVGLVVSRPPGLLSSGGPSLVATLTARPGCGTIYSIQFGNVDTPFQNARVTITSPPGGPRNQTTGFIYTPALRPTSVSLTIERVVQAGGAMVNPIRLYDALICGEWRTFIGGGQDAFR